MCRNGKSKETPHDEDWIFKVMNLAEMEKKPLTCLMREESAED